jgi:hypothetical protein
VAPAQERLTGTNVDVRVGLAYRAPDAAVRRLLPPGWEPNPAASGATRGANLNMNLLEQLTAQDGEGKPVAPLRGVVMTVPAKKTGSDTAGPMVFCGLFAAGAPGAYGVYLPAKVTVDRQSRTDPAGQTSVEESWDFRSDDGHALQVGLAYVRGAAASGRFEARVYSAARPDFFRIYRVESASDVARSEATGVDRVSRFALKASGAKIAALFDGSEQLVAITSIPWYSRQVYVPA